jgi:hypothetical protein
MNVALIAYVHGYDVGAMDDAVIEDTVGLCCSDSPVIL